MPKGDNFKKGGKNYISKEEAQERGRKGGKIGGLAEVPKGFADVEVQAKAQLSRKLNSETEGGNDEESTSQETKTEA